MRRPRSACLRPSDRGGFATLAAWDPILPRLCGGVTCPSASVRTSRSGVLRAWSSTDRTATGPVAVDDLPGGATQRIDADLQVGVPGVTGAVACRAPRPPPQDDESMRISHEAIYQSLTPGYLEQALQFSLAVEQFGLHLDHCSVVVDEKDSVARHARPPHQSQTTCLIPAVRLRRVAPLARGVTASEAGREH